jgi:basic amino acid/polyamine antiporter, APA family
MKEPSTGRAEQDGHRRDAYVTIERRVGAPRLFATAYSTVGSSIYFALGVVASYALGLTPVVFLIASVLFILTTLTYFEGMTLYPERGGSAVMARYGFNELLSFVAGWAILLDFLILIAISALAIGHYLAAFSSVLDDAGAELAIALLVLLTVARYNYLGLAPRGRRSAALAVVDLALVTLIVVIGLTTNFHPSAITDSVQLGKVPKWSDFFFGTTVAVIAYTGIEAAANLAPEVRVKSAALRKTVSAGAIAVIGVFVGMSFVALMALPVKHGIPVVGSQDSGSGTDLGGRYVESPVLGVVDALTSGVAGHLLQYAVAIVATLVLSQAANAGMVGIARTTYTLATHRQLPRGVARLHPRYGTPWIVLVIFTALAAVLLLPRDIELLAGMFAYGALIAFALAHLSVCRLRFKEPDRRRPFKVPFNVKLRGGELPIPAALGAILSIAGWVGTVIYHDQARLLGTAWMAVGLLIYVMYRTREGLSLTRRVEVPAERLTYEPEVTYGNILVPVFGEDLDDDIMSTAGQLASDRGPQGGAMIEAIYVLVVPMALPLDAPLPEQRIAEAQKALERAERVGEEYEDVDVVTTLVRGRTVGSAIVEEARRRKVEAIVIGAEPPSPIKGGSMLGGIAGRRPQELGEVTAYVLEKAPCRVLVTAPPDSLRPREEEREDDTRGERPVSATPR